MPLAMTLSPEKDRVIVLLNGWREQGIQVVDRASGRVLQTIPLPAVFLGITFSPDGKSLYVSGGNEDVIYRFDWHSGQATLADSIALAVKQKGKSGTRYPAGIAISGDGRTLYAAENLGDSLAVVDLAARRVVQRLATEQYPYGVVAGPDGTVYVRVGRVDGVGLSGAGERNAGRGKTNPGGEASVGVVAQHRRIATLCRVGKHGQGERHRHSQSACRRHAQRCFAGGDRRGQHTKRAGTLGER